MCFLQDGELRIICTSEHIYTQDFDFTWYPFDVQIFEIPSTLGNNQIIQQNFIQSNVLKLLCQRELSICELNLIHPLKFVCWFKIVNRRSFAHCEPPDVQQDSTWCHYGFIWSLFLFPFSDWKYDRWWLTLENSNNASILVSGWDLVTEDQDPINTTYLFPPADAEGMLQKLLNTCSKS